MPDRDTPVGASISVVIAAHPKREHLVDDLLGRLEWPATRTVWDEKDNEWDTHQRAWEAVDPSSNWGLVLQDDCLPVRDLVPALSRALYLRTEVVALYFGNAYSHVKIARAAEQATAQDAGWIYSTGVWWGVGVAMPTPMIPEMLAFCRPRWEVYDRRLTLWTGATNRLVLYPWPSLVDHRDEPSLVNPARKPGRRAYRFLGQDESALGAWNPRAGAVPCGRIGLPVPTTLMGDD